MLQQVTNTKEIRSAWSVLQRTMADGAVRLKKSVGARSGAEVSNLYVREKLGIWMLPQAIMDDGSLFCAFGVLPFKQASNQDMIVLFNANLDFRKRSKAALLARDSEGESWICHTGRVGGGRKGIGKDAFLASIDREPTEALDFKGRSMAVLPIAQIGSCAVGLPHDENPWPSTQPTEGSSCRCGPARVAGQAAGCRRGVAQSP